MERLLWATASTVPCATFVHSAVLFFCVFNGPCALSSGYYFSLQSYIFFLLWTHTHHRGRWWKVEQRIRVYVWDLSGQCTLSLPHRWFVVLFARSFEHFVCEGDEVDANSGFHTPPHTPHHTTLDIDASECLHFECRIPVTAVVG